MRNDRPAPGTARDLFPLGPLALGVLWLSCRSGAEAPAVTFHPREGRPVTVEVEVADTPEARSLGLMYRRDLPENRGMLFLFEGEADRPFWMKNTPIPLDIVFVSAQGEIVGIAANARPFSLERISAGQPSRMVVEVRGGFAQRHGLRPGDRVTLSGISSPLAP